MQVTLCVRYFKVDSSLKNVLFAQQELETHRICIAIDNEKTDRLSNVGLRAMLT